MKNNFKRRELKRSAKINLKRHYFLVLMLCLFASFFGVEYGMSSYGIQSNYNLTDLISHPFTTLFVASDEDSQESETKEADIAEMARKISQGKGKEVRAQIKAREKSLQDSGDSKILSRRKGVLSGMMNSYSAGAFRYRILEALMSISGSENFAITLIILASLAGYLFIWLFIKETYRIVMRRMILEGRTYDTLTIQRFLFPYTTRSWTQIAWNMFVTSLYRFLWSLTIVGGFIKRYSYAMVPYILAENPKLKANQVVTLSRRMMNGHKWELFVADLSFLGWDVLDMCTVGISGLLYSNPYKATFYGEYYARRREEALAENMEGVDLLCDVYLYEKASGSLLQESYPEITRELMEGNLRKFPEQKGFTGFLSKWFGIELFHNDRIEEYEKNQAMQYQLELGQAILDGKSYPGKLAPAPMAYKLRKSISMYSNRSYSLLNLIYIFFVMSFVGWVWEVSLHLIEDGQFVNRGVLHGPWLPIYGSGSILILVLLKHFRKNPAIQMLLTMVVCGVVEYTSAWFLEIKYNGQKWWDYSGYFLNLDGRICAEGLLVFGLGGVAIVYFLAPIIDNLLRQVNPKALFLVAIMLVSIFSFDQIYSSKHPNTGRGISTDRNKKVATRMVESKAPAARSRRKSYA